MASAVTYEMVEDVCNHLAAGGESPTYLKVHQRLGKGSTRIVSAYIRQWREAQVLSQALERDPLFGEWPEALQLKARSLFDGLLALSAEAANASAETCRRAFEEREQALAAEVQEAARASAAALGRLHGEQARTAHLEAEVRSLEAAAEARQVAAWAAARGIAHRVVTLPTPPDGPGGVQAAARAARRFSRACAISSLRVPFLSFATALSCAAICASSASACAWGRNGRPRKRPPGWPTTTAATSTRPWPPCASTTAPTPPSR